VSVIEKTAPEAAVETAPVGDQRVSTIRPPTRWPTIDLRELWRYRELAAVFVWRDIKVKYKQTFVGVAWAVLQPLVTTVIFTLIFGRFANFPTEVDYPIFVLSGVVLWTYFAASLNGASSSIASSRGLVTKVYFPRILLPLGAILTPIVDLIVVLPVVVALMVYFGVYGHVDIALAPLFVLLAAATAFGTGLLFSVANVRYRDVPYAIPFVINIWMWLSPVVYSVNLLDLQDRYRWILSLNPMTAAITGFRWALLGTSPPGTIEVILGSVVATVLLVAGLFVFRRAEPRFADTI
jgi:lipopolysaccharide transport system permease protein